MNTTVTAKRRNYRPAKARAIVPVDGMKLAVEAYCSPSRFRRLLESRPFGQVLTVIKAAAGDEKVLAEQAMIYRMAPAELQEAAKHLLLRHLLRPDVSGNQLLGLPADASLSELKNHKRWLLKWLHPDRNPSTWEQRLFHRVNDLKLESTGPAPPIAEQHTHLPETRSARRTWALAKRRKRRTSLRHVFFRLVWPLLVGALGVAILIVALMSLGDEFMRQVTTNVGWHQWP